MKYTPSPWNLVKVLYSLGAELDLDNSANANVLKAAPDLYEALRGLYEMLETGMLVLDPRAGAEWGPDLLHYVVILQKAHTALRKAEGAE